MTFFNAPNRDAYSVAPDAAATGPRVGFLESFNVSYQAQTRGSAMRGIDVAMNDASNEQVMALRKAGVESVPFLITDTGDGYEDVARFYEDGGTEEQSRRLQEYDARIEKLRTELPQLNLRTSREIWEGVKSKAQEYEARASNDRRTLGGSIGGFLGGAVGAVNPDTDPLNFWTLGMGGAGKSIATRVAGQAGVQGVVETLNQITGVQEQRRLIGLDYGVGDAIQRVAGAAVGGAALQGAGEALAFGVRRWFRSTPKDPAPLPGVTERPRAPDTSAVPSHVIPADETLAAAKLQNDPASYVNYIHEASPLSGTRAGRARTVLDLDYMTERLNDWNGDEPWRIAPKTDTAVTLPRNDFVAPDLHRVADKSQIDSFAREIDPRTFDQYDALATRKESYQRWIRELSGEDNPDLDARVAEVDDKIDALMVRLQDETGKRAAKLRKDLAALNAEKENMIAEAAGGMTPDVQKVRQSLMKVDEQMRDLAPLVSRAYSRARNQWNDSIGERMNVMKMMREGRRSLPEAADAARIVDGAQAMSIADKVPALRDAPLLPKAPPPDAPAVDVASAVVAERIKAFDEAVETYRSEIDLLLASEKNGEIEVAGVKLNLDSDKLVVPNDKGGTDELSLRQVIEQDRNAEYELEAVSTCSLRKSS